MFAPAVATGDIVVIVVVTGVIVASAIGDDNISSSSYLFCLDIFFSFLLRSQRTDLIKLRASRNINCFLEISSVVYWR